MNIHQKICRWYEENKRDLPWRRTQNPYHIWLSEVILQQTRVQQGLPYYIDFINTFPNIEDLAAASQDEVLRHWQGLGYYSRARNLHQTAKIVAYEYGGRFPDTYEELLKLKGIGPYTASAIASFAFNRACAVVDGNVYRVLSRLYDIDSNILDSGAYSLFCQIAQATMLAQEADKFNQAIMEFGALHCTAQHPRCEECPLSEHCLALARHHVDIRPVRIKRLKKKERFLHYLFVYNDQDLWIKQRKGQDIWKGLWEFPMIEEDRLLPWEDLWQKHPQLAKYCGENYCLQSPSLLQHHLTHQDLRACFFPIKVADTHCLPEEYNKVSWSELDTYALSRLTLKFLEKFNF